MENIISSFQEIVSRMPDETAVIFEGRRWTYRELDLQSDRIAALLSGYQVAGRQIGAAMNRGQEWIAALLGIWKAGAVYVPLDLNHPRERLETIIKDCEISLVICSRGSSFKPSVTPFCYLDELSSGDGESLSLPLPREHDRAYIIYTSGTSGEPKGIPASHRQAARMSRIARDKYFYVHAGDRMLQLAGLNFSASLVEILTALLNGVCLVIVGDKERQDPRLLIALIEREHVVSAIIPPALLAVFPKVPIPGLETLLVAGEGVAADVKDYWMKGRRMVNAYGFTENTVLVMSGVYQEDTPANDIGMLVPDSVAYVLDEEGKPVPDGMPGELCIGGSQLTEGYWKRPELNVLKFIPNPFLTDDECRAGRNLHLFKSGDKVMRLSDGHFLYLGRLDNQVKIRGMRIELSEVEQCLNRYPGVTMSVVQAKERRGRKVLVAYLQADREVDQEKITAFIAGKLPDYMCPAYYVTLQDFPMTINRKIDKARLPEPDWKHSAEWKEESATLMEREIAQIWCDMLGVPVAGRYDNFISLGGDSISVLLLTNVLEEKFGISLKAEDVFARLELNVLAQFVEQLKSETRHTFCKVSHKDVYDYYPLSPALRNLWGQCVSSPEVNESYKLALFLPWGSDLDVDAFQHAWNRIVQEQEVMRMSFPLNADGEPYAHVAPFVYADIPVRHIGEDELWKEVRELYFPSFLLEKGPLHRACLYRYPDGEYMLVVIIHHLVTDGWSARLLDEKLQAYYLQCLQGSRASVDGCSYRDYMIWSREQSGNELKEERKSFWQKYLSGCTFLSFEGKVTRVGTLQKQGGAKYLPMDRDLGEQLESFCERHAVTPLVACLSVFQLVLLKYTGKSDFLVGIAATDRKRSEFRELLGYFATLLPVRVTRMQEESFAGYTQMLMKEIITLLSRTLPLNLILESLGENAARPVHAIRFAFGVEEVPSGVDVPEEWITSSPFDMALIIHKYKGDYSFHFQYATACFDEKFIIQFCDSFQAALRFLLKEPSCTMGECSLLSPEEINKRISPFQFSELVLPERSVVDQFEEIASGAPDREAYCWAELRVSYGELKRASDALAADIRERFLCRGGKGQKERIGIYLNEKQYLLPAILGVLKSGSCYVPLDRALPAERLAFILEDADVSMVLVDDSLAFHLPCETLLIRNSVEKKRSVDFHLSSPGPEDAAYIIYTSGTTGKPKGIPISHRSLALFARSQAEVYRLLPGKRVLQYASIGFDASVMEVFPALISKASLVIPTEEERKDPRLLLDLMEKEKVYCTLLPPALLSILPYRPLPDLETLVVGGESTPGDVMDRWMQGRRLVNAYGPTENTVVTTCSEVSGGFLSNDIGTPLPGVSCYVLSESMTLLPDYVPGELYIGGLQLTEGYINRPALNREKFVTNPFVCPEDRKMGRNTLLYKSGDRVMRTSEGSLLFLGRMDSQVKMRGFRIEPDEIARQLEEYPGILHAIVLLKEYGEEKRLAAYLLAGKETEVELAGVRNFLASRLPAYMIPSAWAVMETFPLTLNGKVDRKALPEPSLLVVEEYEPPVSRDEKVLARIAAELLQLSRVGVCTDLLDLGLTSLQVMELVHDARQEKVAVSVTDVYKGKSIRSILADKKNALYCRCYDPDDRKPVIILVCGYPYFKPFYDRFVECFKDDFSFFVFDSFLAFFQEKEEVSCDDLMDHYCDVLQTELRGKEIYAVAGHCLGGELGMLLAERLRANEYPSVKALIIEGFLRRDKSLLLPDTTGDGLLQKQGRITNALIESMPELSFGGEMIVCLATKAPHRFMFEISQPDSDRLIREMWTASEKNRADWKRLYPGTICHMLDADHWSVFEAEPLTALYKIVKNHWITRHLSFTTKKTLYEK